MFPYYRLPLGPNQSLQLYDSTLAGFLAHISGSVFGSSLVAPRLGDLDLPGLVGRFVDELSINGLLLGALRAGCPRPSWPCVTGTGAVGPCLP